MKHQSEAHQMETHQMEDSERFRRFGQEIDAIRARVEAKVGAEDVAHVKQIDRFSRAMEVARPRR